MSLEKEEDKCWWFVMLGEVQVPDVEIYLSDKFPAFASWLNHFICPLATPKPWILRLYSAHWLHSLCWNQGPEWPQ